MKKILLICREEDIDSYIVNYFCSKIYQVMRKSSFEEASRILEGHEIAIILISEEIYVEDRDLLDNIKDRHTVLPGMIFVGSHKNFYEICEKHDDIKHLAKPIKIRELLNIFEESESI